MRKPCVFAILFLLVLSEALCFLLSPDDKCQQDCGIVASRVKAKPVAQTNEWRSGFQGTAKDFEALTVPSEIPDGEDLCTDDELLEAKRLDDFFDLVGKWTKSRDRQPNVRDVAEFVSVYKKTPKNCRSECIHRALNLIPDRNIMLLAGILFDKSIDKTTVQTVFQDVLNRDNEAKNNIIEEIYKDKTHPCWDDVRWIFEVTGETPKEN